MGDSFVNITLVCTVLLLLIVKRCRRTAVFWTLAGFGGLLAVQLLKWTIHLPRPVAIYHGASAYGFPSAHTTMNLVLYGFLAIMVVRQIAGAWRWALFSAVGLIAFIIGFSRLYLGAHWLSDVLGGYFIGISWATLLGIAYLKKGDKAVPRRLLGGTVLTVVIIAGGWHIAQQHKKDLAFYAPRYKMQTIMLASYTANGWRELPAYRIDLAGERGTTLNHPVGGVHRRSGSISIVHAMGTTTAVRSEKYIKTVFFKRIDWRIASVTAFEQRSHRSRAHYSARR